MLSSVFIAASAAVALLLGFLHLLYTFRGPKLHPRDPDLTEKMKTISPVISRGTTMWRAWIGFNASHSFGIILFGAVYGYLASCHSVFLFHSWFLLALGFALLLGYAVLAKLYWFRAPFRGVLLAAVLYLLGIVLNLATQIRRWAILWITRKAASIETAKDRGQQNQLPAMRHTLSNTIQYQRLLIGFRTRIRVICWVKLD